ncbi:MAG: hypothetical protein EAZ09_00240 [Oscillatoriales cyanobacterium]|nr:MAG: hypothetical protein EAZ09_00240 [Oscillatoriales cyanobacterium]
MDGQDAHPTRNSLFVEQAGEPVADIGAVEQAGEPVADIGARSQFNGTCADRTKKPTQSFQPSIIEGKSNG